MDKIKILYADIEWYENFDNSARLRLLVNQKPCLEVYIFTGIEVGHGSTFYHAEIDGFVSHFWHNPKDERGFGGRSFNLKTHDGEITIKGPWDSGTSSYEMLVGSSLSDIIVTDSLEVLQRGYTFSHAYIKTEIIVEYLQKYLSQYTIENGEIKRKFELRNRMPRLDRDLLNLMKENKEFKNDNVLRRHFNKYYTIDWQEFLEKE